MFSASTVQGYLWVPRFCDCSVLVACQPVAVTRYGECITACLVRTVRVAVTLRQKV